MCECVFCNKEKIRTDFVYEDGMPDEVPDHFCGCYLRVKII